MDDAEMTAKVAKLRAMQAALAEVLGDSVARPQPRQCFTILVGQVGEHGYIPSLVTEGEPGHQPLVGRGELSEPWYWGKTLEQAGRVCELANAETFGLDAAEAKEITDSSITASIRRDAAAERVAAKLAR